MQVGTTRSLYAACPLCAGSSLEDHREADCTEHPLYHPDLDPRVSWRRCGTCEHVFAAGHLTEPARRLLAERRRPEEEPGRDIEMERRACARIVTTLTMVRGELCGRWLDVGFGGGALLTTADEFGYAVTGIETRPHLVEALTDMGYPVLHETLAGLAGEEVYDVVSLDHVLQRTARPEEELGHVRRLLRHGGLAFVALPNRDSFAFKELDRRGANPCWSEVEDHHVFGRDGLYRLLRKAGLEPVHFAVSERHPASIEVIAVRG